ncbi:MAG: PAS domain S-box protein, partial [Pseudomonadota bacterium]|nr:PAS domain S-box protein [Pseudomonadota bacterium]
QSEHERQRDDLIRDTLWVEQTLEFHRNTDQENLDRLALELGDNISNRDKFATLAPQLVSNNPELQEIIWRDADGGSVAVVPPASILDSKNHALDLAIADAAAKSGTTGQGALSAPIALHDNGYVLIYAVPIFSQGRNTGTLATVFSLGTILSHQIPWWIAEKSAVQIKDANGVILASRSHIEISPRSTINIVPLSNFGPDLSLVLSPYKEQTNLTTNGLVGAMILLGLVAIGGLFAREKHMRQRRKAEAALRTEYAFRKAMEDSLTVGVRAHDLEGRIIYVNNAFCQMTGYDSHELLGHLPPMPYWLPDEIDRTVAFHDAVLAGNVPQKSIELSFRQKSGDILHALVFEAPLIDDEGIHRGWMGSFIDITDRKVMEATAKAHLEKLAQTARLIMIGEVASLIAHDLNQPLAAITSYSTGLSNRFKVGTIAPQTTLKTLDKISKLARHAGSIVHKVQDFVKKSGPRFEPTDIGDAVMEAIALYDRESRSHPSRIVVTKSTPALLANVDPVLIEQVIINLVRNAEEAMRALPTAKRRIDISVAKASDEIQIQVADRGPALSAETKSSIFKPFFTTKPDGMGIGLTICRSILEAHYGRLTYTARERGGSVFACCLPAATVSVPSQ